MTQTVSQTMAQNEVGENIARLLLRTGAIHVSGEQPFILAAGWASPVYVDCRVLIGQPDVRRTVTDLAAAFLQSAFPQQAFGAVAGAETAGIAFAALIAERLGLPLRYVRKRSLGIGRHAQVEGGAVEGLNVLLLDDLTTDGGSKLAFVRGLRSAGAAVSNVLTIFYNNAFPAANERLTANGLALHALATWQDIMRVNGDGALAGRDRSIIETFLADPVAWSTRHGGRAALRA
jgi:orotate phosphoribosyltransferase